MVPRCPRGVIRRAAVDAGQSKNRRGSLVGFDIVTRVFIFSFRFTLVRGPGTRCSARVETLGGLRSL